MTALFADATAHRPLRDTPADPDAPRLLLKLWLLTLPITSVLVVPALQGTTPANLLALACILPGLHGLFVPATERAFHHRFLALLFLLALSIGLSQFALVLSDITPDDLAGIPLASLQQGHYLRLSLISQSLYLVTGFAVFCFFWTYYDRTWDRWLLAGALLLAGHGFFEVAWSAATGTSGDFLSNRTFSGGFFPGSLVQFHGLFGLPMMRLKSLTGEPSMYAITILPYLALALYRRRTVTGAILAASLFLSVSTTALLGLALLAPYAALLFARRRRYAVVTETYLLVLALSIATLFFADRIADFIDQTVLRKLQAGDVSGWVRLATHDAAIRLWENGSGLTQLFGIGFGYVRAADLFSTLLVNIGAVGLIGWIALYCYPLSQSIAATPAAERFAYPMAVLLILMMIAVPEFAYPAPWALLGVSYRLAGARSIETARYRCRLDS